MRHQHPTIEQSKDGNFPHPLGQPFIPQRLSSDWEAVLELPMSTEGVSPFLPCGAETPGARRPV